MAKATKTESYSPVKRGYDPRSEEGKGGNFEGSAGWLSVKENESVIMTALVNVEDIISTEQCAIWLSAGQGSPVWCYTGPNDPYNDLQGPQNVTKGYKAFLPVLVDGEPKVWGISKTNHKMICEIAEGTDLQGMKLRVKRTGTGKNTRYTIVFMGKREDVSHVEEVDVLSMLGPLTTGGVQELIAEKLKLDSYEDVLDSFSAKRKTGTKAKVVEPEDEDDLEEIDEMELA